MQFLGKRGIRISLSLGLVVLLQSQNAPAFEDYGTLSGQFVLQGDIPQRTVLVKKGDQSVKDASVCAANELLSDDLIVDPETKGVANVFIYLRKAPKIHPDLAATPKDKLEVTFDQKGCRFLPHCMLLRTDQVVLVKSGDDCSHNTHTNPLRNKAENFLVTANNRIGERLTHPVPEIFPIKVNCDIHGWMLAYWLILDHPYFALTDEKGRFTIEKLPAGTHQLRVWHERIGNINVDKDFKVVRRMEGKPDEWLTVDIEKPEMTLEPIEIPVERFTSK